MNADRLAVDVPVVKTLSLALGDVADVFTITFAAGDTPPRNSTGLEEWDQVWHKFAAYSDIIDDVITMTQGQVDEIIGAIESATDYYTIMDQENAEALTPPQP
jgi:hypothetical protein